MYCTATFTKIKLYLKKLKFASTYNYFVSTDNDVSFEWAECNYTNIFSRSIQKDRTTV